MSATSEPLNIVSSRVGGRESSVLDHSPAAAARQPARGGVNQTLTRRPHPAERRRACSRREGLGKMAQVSRAAARAPWSYVLPHLVRRAVFASILLVSL